MGAGDAHLPIVDITHLVTDSRNLMFPATSLFFALPGKKRDGHLFVRDAYERGCRFFVVHKDEEIPTDLPEGYFLQVHDVLHALQVVATEHRKQFTYPVVGITGSNGKTVVKEWLFQVLHDSFTICRSPRSFNSQVGVPLSVWQMDHVHDLALIEAGISANGEMDKLESIIRPTIGIFTYLGEAHAAGFHTMTEKAREKLLLFRHAAKLVYCTDDPVLEEEVKRFVLEVNPSLQLISWSKMNDRATFFLRKIVTNGKGTTLTVVHAAQVHEIHIAALDEASIHNAMSVFVAAIVLGESSTSFQATSSAGDVASASFAGDIGGRVNSIISAMAHLRPLEMRLELKQGKNDNLIINDSYSADPDSLQIALDFLQQQKQHSRRTVILSDIPQTGMPPKRLYEAVAANLEGQKLHRFIGIGEQLIAHKELFSKLPNAAFYPDTVHFLHEIDQADLHHETILLKGARSFRFETIARALEQKVHETVLHIDLDALRHNFRHYRDALAPGVKMMVMVKAFAYGSGSDEVAMLLQHAGADYIGVAYADEGVDLREAGISLPIMVMNTEAAGFDQVVKHGLEPELYSLPILRAFIQYLHDRKITDFPIHLKLDTGMHRLGFGEADVEELLPLLLEKEVKVRSVFSHLAGSDEARFDDFTWQQSALFQAMVKQIGDVLPYHFIRHLANTSAIIRHPGLQLDMVRLGIGLYGVDADPKTQQQLENVTTLKTTISQLRTIAAGESVGYSRKGLVSRESVIATVRIGYADGYPRILGNGNGKMMIRGQLAPVIGNVCMDMTMLDVTGLLVEEEDEVTVFGEELPVTMLAEWAQTIPYEILTNISQRVRRLYFQE